MHRFEHAFVRSVGLFLCAILVSSWALGPVTADEAKNQNLWDAPQYGFSWTKPDDPEWGFIPEDNWGVLFGGTKPEGMVAALAKWTVPGGKVGKDNWKILILVWQYEGDKKVKIGSKDYDCGNVKGMCTAFYEQDLERYKDIKNDKKPNVVGKYKFEKKVMVYSFNGINKQYGGTSWNEGMYFKGNNKYMFRFDINCPSMDEKQVRHELDRVLNQIRIGKPAKD